jgi:hypothetical protein
MACPMMVVVIVMMVMMMPAAIVVPRHMQALEKQCRPDPHDA